MPIPDLYKYARDVADHKTVWQRIAHSPALHTTRSAISSGGSALSKTIKLAGVAGQGACRLIPIPVLGSFVETAVKYLEEKGRGKYLKGRAEHATPGEQKVKFDLKELSLEEMDRYRWKVHQSVTALNTAVQHMNETFQKAESDHAICAAYVELAIAAEQASRRIEKLNDKCFAVAGVMKETMDWLQQLFGDVDKPESVCGIELQIKQRLANEIRGLDVQLSTHSDKAAARKSFIDEYHSKCTGWCWAKDTSAPTTYSFPKAVEYSAAVLKWASAAFSMDDLAAFGEIAKDKIEKKG